MQLLTDKWGPKRQASERSRRGVFVAVGLKGAAKAARVPCVPPAAKLDTSQCVLY